MNKQEAIDMLKSTTRTTLRMLREDIAEWWAEFRKIDNDDRRREWEDGWDTCRSDS